MATSVSRKPLLARIFQKLPKSSLAQVPFRIRCACGQTVCGRRRRQALELICPKCSARLFVLPRSAWPPMTATQPAVPQPPAPAPTPLPLGRPSPLRVWLLPLCVGLFALVTACWCIWVYGPQVARSARQDRRSYHEHSTAASVALQRGEFARAATELEAGARAWQRDGNPPDRETQAAHYRLLEQARFLAELCPMSLEQALTWAEDQEARHPRERTKLAEELPHRVLVFDTALHMAPGQLPDENRALVLDYQVFGGSIPVQVDLSNQEGLLKLVPQDKPQRWVFAVRLDSIRLQADPEHPKGFWVIRFEPNSAMLLSDARLFQAWGLQTDIPLAAVLERQQRLHLRAPRGHVFQDEPAMIGATREQLRAKLSPPDSIARQLWQKQYMEQWHYAQRRLRVNLHSSNCAAPQVVTWHKLGKQL